MPSESERVPQQSAIGISPDESRAIIDGVQQIFLGADRHDWKAVQAAFAPSVILDYESLSGEPARTQSPSDIFDAWKGFLPGFDATFHRLTNFETRSMDGSSAVCRFYGDAVHYIADADAGEVWQVVGAYEAKLDHASEEWRVNGLRFSLGYQAGNLALPEEAQKRME